MSRIVRIDTREHLLSTLAETAELEHNLMCLYLYAAFSLKRDPSENLTGEELAAVTEWRRVLLEVAVQEMAHLALVSNLTTAVGGSAHFFRSDFPVRPGYFPSDFVMQLAPFDFDTLEHFVFLERPEDSTVTDDSVSAQEVDYDRDAVRGRLMTHVGEYSTVGQLYLSVEKGIERLAATLGENLLFCGHPSLQLGPEEVKLAGLQKIGSVSSAQSAIKFIVEQGEGARTTVGSHFEKFEGMRATYLSLLAKNRLFRPARDVVRNPVMRKPASPEGVAWVNAEPAASHVDLANALYELMLRFLVQIYSMENRSAAARRTLLSSAFSLMKAISEVGSNLTRMTSSAETPDATAGMTFALNRHVGPYEVSSEKRILLERAEDILAKITSLGGSGHGAAQMSLKRVGGDIADMCARLRKTALD